MHGLNRIKCIMKGNNIICQNIFKSMESEVINDEIYIIITTITTCFNEFGWSFVFQYEWNVSTNHTCVIVFKGTHILLVSISNKL